MDKITPKHHIVLKKNLLTTITLLLLLNLGLNAANRYWVGGTGSWNDAAHWSAFSGGPGGAGAPGTNDDVFFDEYSGGSGIPVVSISGTANCNNLVVSPNLGTIYFAGSGSAVWGIYGSFSFSSYVRNDFSGEILFAGAGPKNIDFSNAMPGGNVHFNGHGTWTLNSNLLLSFNSSLMMESGQLNAIGKDLQAFGVQWLGTASKGINISNSRMILAQALDETGTGNSVVIKTGAHVYSRHTGISRSIDSVQTVVVAPLCNISQDGSITVTVFASTSTGPFTFDWTGGSCPCTGNPLNGIGAGSYLLTVTDQSDFETYQIFVQVIAPNPIGVNFIKKKPKCNGQCNGQITANVVVGSGTAPYTYSWSTGGTTPTKTGLCAGAYVLTVTDAHGCIQTFNTTLTQPAAVLPNLTSTNILCAGTCTGTANSAPTGGNVPTGYTYAWSSPGPPAFSSTSQNLTGLCAGTYNIIVKDDSLCQGTSSVTITSPPPITTTPLSTNVTCFGACNGTATVSPVAGGTGAYTFNWTGSAPGPYTGQGTASLTNLCPGTYTVTITDANGCVKTNNFTITQPAPIVATASGTNVTCFNACNGTGTVVVTGGTSPFNYNWNPGNPPGDGTPNVSGLCAGSYTVTVTDANTCSDTGLVVITEPPLLVPNPTSTDVTCFGLCNGTATAAPVGGTLPYTYLWTGSVPGPYTGQGTPNLTNLCPGNYCVNITDANGCDTLQCVTITQPPILSVGLVKTNVTCNGACNGTITATPAGGSGSYTFVWTGTTPGPYTGQGTASLSALCPGTYTVTVTDANGCTITQSTSITQPNILNVTLNATVLLCNGDCNSTITSTVTGGTGPYLFSWVPGGFTTPSVTNQCAGVHTLTVTDANGCVKVVSITINQPTALTVVTSSTNLTCFNVCNGTVSAIAGGGTPGYSYSWAPGGATTPNLTGLCAGSYTVTVTDANGCTVTSIVTVTSPPQLLANPSVSSNVTCSGLCNGTVTSATTGGTGAYIYSWSPGITAAQGQGTPTLINLCAGNYNLLVTDSAGCTSSQGVTVTQPSPLTAPITGSTSSCNVCNGTATVTAAGGTVPYSYLWNDGQITPVAVGLCPLVSYTVVVTDANGCTASSSVLIAQTITITITTSNTTLSCFDTCDGTATANPSGGQIPYSYLWVGSGGTVPGGSGPTVTNLCADTYTVTVVDANGCLNSSTVTFTNPPQMNIAVTHTDATCGGSCNGTASATVTGGTGAYSYSWNTSPVQTTATATGLCAGTYTLTVTDANGCNDTVSVIITEPTVVTDNVVINDANCLLPDGSITVAPTGGTGAYTYLWAPGITAAQGQGTPTVSTLFPGAYTLTITDASGCPFNFNYIISNINGPNLVMAHTNVTCNNVADGTATVTASGGAGGFSYNWGPGTPSGQGTTTITALGGTVTYTVTVTDAAGCITIDTATVINPTPISPNQVVVNESCGGTCDGTITLSPSGGAGGYTYAWTSPVLPATSSQTGLCAGSYVVTISDANGCDTTITVTLTSPPALTVTTVTTDVLCTGACNGTATATAMGGTGAGTYSYSWLPNPPLGPTFPLPNIVNLCPGTYSLTVTDGNGCTAMDTIVITEPTPLTVTTSQVNASCNATCDGVAMVTPGGGTPGYNFSWSLAGLPNNDTASALCAGTYFVTVTDANGCTNSPPAIIITQPAPIVANITSTNASCNGSCNGTASAAPAGGTLPYTYDWNGTPPGDGTSAVTGLCGGIHSLTITDFMGCSVTQSFTLTDPPALTSNPTSTSPTCNNSCDGTATATPAGGTPTYTYSWSPGGATTQTVSSLCPGIYTVIVTDNNTCKDTQTVTVINPPVINIATSSTPASCGMCDGTITVNPITGTPSYTYVWSPAPTAGQGTPNATSVCAGLYDVTVTDANGCTNTFTIPMNNSGGVTGETVTTSDATCNALCNGTGSVVPIGGTPPFTYLWNDGPPATANDSAINLCAGSYFVQITDSNSCIHFSPVTINEPTPILSNATVTSAICSSVCNGVISLAASGGTPGAGYTYVWGPGSPAGQGTSTITGLCPGTYSVTITDANGCTKVDSFTVTQSTPLTVAIASTNISCSNVCSGTAYVTISSGTAPFNIQWDDASGQTNDTANALCAGTYTAMVIDSNGCSTSVNTTITSTPAVVLNATVTNAACGQCDGSALAAPSGGTAPYSLLWSNAQTGNNATNLCAGLYTVNVTDNAGCVSSFGVAVSNTTGPTSVAITSTNISCNGVCNGAVTAVTPSGGTAPYTYLWIQNGSTSPTQSGLCAGVYYVQVTDANGCSLVDSVTITEPSPMLANQEITAATCGLCDGGIIITPSGGTTPYTVMWNTGSALDTLTNLCAGVYSVQITDAAGCVANVVVPLSNFNAPSLSLSSTNLSCNGFCNGTATVIATGGTAPYGYLWNDLTAQTTATAISLCAGNYAVQVSGSDGCIAVGTVAITEPDSIGFSIANTVDPLCNGDTTGSITVIPSGGTLSYSYLWSPSGGTGFTASNLAANSYTVTVTDAMGCTATQTTTLVQTTALTIGSVIIPPSCNSLSDGAIDVTVSGGTNTFTYQWSVGSTATTEDLSALASGTYIINVTDGNGCMIADTSVLVPNQSVLVFAGNDTTFCQNGALQLTASSATATSYQWFEIPSNTNVGNTASVNVSPATGITSYYVIADNGSGCTSNDTINVTSNALPTANAGADVTIVAGANATIGGSPTAPSGTTISWSPIPGLDNATLANPTAAPLTTTMYTVTVTTAQGCTASDSMVVTVIPAIIIPDGISPNADGDNDEWIIDGIELFPDCMVEVYNRWGELLFQSPGYKEHWKGTYKGKELPVGTYYYIINLNDPMFPDAYTGPITILR
jgi:gliding motility-associated-like protein